MMAASSERQFRRERKRRVDTCVHLLSENNGLDQASCASHQGDSTEMVCPRYGIDCVARMVDQGEMTADKEQMAHSPGCSGDLPSFLNDVHVVDSSGVDTGGVTGHGSVDRDSSDDRESDVNFRQWLQAWAVESRSSHAAVTSLLKGLRKHSCFASLPSSARTLLQTPSRALNIRELAGGKFHHFGIEAGLRQALQCCEPLPEELSVIFNIDGLPLAKSSRDQFWLILGRVRNFENLEPFVVSVFFGKAKPKDANEFLQCFVDETKALLAGGLLFNGTSIPLKVHSLVCDAPAKAFVLYVRSHTGYYSCTKCSVKGSYIAGRVCFPTLANTLHTDQSFHSKSQEQHHTGRSILEELPMDMVKDIPLDYMHLVCLGVMQKLLLLGCEGQRKSDLVPMSDAKCLRKISNWQSSFPVTLIENLEAL